MKSAEGYKQKNAGQSFSDSRNLPDSCWNYQRNGQSSFNRSSRNAETVAGYHSSSTYKAPKGYTSSKTTQLKCIPPRSGELPRHGLQSHSKFDRDKHYHSKIPAKSKNRYEGYTGELKYVDDEVTEDNGEEIVEEEGTEDEPADTGEFLNKEYDEQEADDEIDEESDPSPQMHREQRACKEADLRQARWKAIDQQQNPRRLRCQQHVLAVGQGHSPTTRFYQHVAKHEVPEPLSDEDFVPTSMRHLTRRSADYHRWSQSRGEPNRHDAAPLHAQSRRARTKPDVNQLVDTEYTRTRKCHRCGSLSNRANVSPLRNGCRFNDRDSFPTKGPIGDEPESHEQTFCGRCVMRHNPGDTNGVNDMQPSLYATKPRKFRDTKSPAFYQIPQQDRMDRLASDYSRSSSRYHRKPDHEKTKRSLHASYGLPHLWPRYEE
ncbi:uncharacterized protein LOC116432665 [Nomia melanderi]|uniref:uncharacterized protein LOC116432665 n=1 Tax=Nomia melanderi TaxID=2448451 RepID=UPI001303F680|nr:uncharacterized protein LOC116432665 [Nomia melanderi]